MADITEVSRSGLSGAAQTEDRRFQILAVGLGAVLATLMLLATGKTFTFANQAIAKAGENPPPAVSLHLGRLVYWQGMARALLGLGLMGLALGAASYAAPPRGAASRRMSFAGLLAALLIGLAIGAAAGVVGYMVFGLRHVGDQDLTVAAVVHGIVWAGMGCGTGIAAGGRLAERSASVRVITRGSVAGLLWGIVYPPLLALLAPWIYVERLIPEVTAAATAWSLIGAVTVGLAVSGIAIRQQIDTP